ncbi:MAG: helix-turn-helix domain-containing protein [Marmoricola sp.]
MPSPRFISLADVAELLGTSHAQVYALVRRGDLRALQIGDRRQWRVDVTELEKYIESEYARAESYIADNPFREVEQS